MRGHAPRVLNITIAANRAAARGGDRATQGTSVQLMHPAQDAVSVRHAHPVRAGGLIATSRHVEPKGDCNPSYAATHARASGLVPHRGGAGASHLASPTVAAMMERSAPARRSRPVDDRAGYDPGFLGVLVPLPTRPV